MNITFKYLRITDNVSKISKKIVFSPNDNLITSEKNSVGKSVLMKSLYHCLGADSAFDDNFYKDQILYELVYSCNDVDYKIMRFKNNFCLFKNDSLVSFVKQGDRTALSQFYLNEFGMSVYLKNRQNTTEIAPPAYLFVPYYLDQDRSWKEDQEPFSKQTMGQYEPLSRHELYLYHLGLLHKNYGQLKSELDAVKNSRKKKSKELKLLDDTYIDIKNAIDATEIITNPEELENLYRVNSKKVEDLLLKQKQILNDVFLLDQKRTELLIRIRNNKNIIDKINANKNPNSLIVKCPNCNTEFDLDLENDISKVYSAVLLENENKSLEIEQVQYLNQISNLKEEANKLSIEIAAFNDEVAQTRSDYQKYVGRMALSSLLEKQLSQITTIHTELTALENTIKEKEEKIKEIKEKTDSAKRDFVSYYCDYLNALDVTLYNVDSIKPFVKTRLSGSQYVRSTLAFFFAFLKIKQEYNKSSFNWPLVIDSPREGEQDDVNSSGILKFVLNENYYGLQRIVASVDAKKYIDPEALSKINVIELSNKFGSVMNKEEYEIEEDYINECLAFFKR